MSGTAIPTHGEGKRCNWMNTTTTLADAWRREARERIDREHKERDK